MPQNNSGPLLPQPLTKQQPKRLALKARTIKTGLDNNSESIHNLLSNMHKEHQETLNNPLSSSARQVMAESSTGSAENSAAHAEQVVDGEGT